MSGNGFGSNEKLKLEYGGSSDDPTTQQKKWELAYKAFIKTMGKYLTGASWEGYNGLGRGAVYVNMAVKGEGRSGKKTLYIPLSEYGKRSPRSEQEAKDLQQILARIESYNPEREFVVIFEAAGLMGTDVVKPSTPPPEIHRILGSTQNDVPTQDLNDELAKYWINPGPIDTQDAIDVTSLIMDATEAENSVLEISNRIGEYFDDQKEEPSNGDGRENSP